MAALDCRGVMAAFCAAFAVYSVFVYTGATELPEARAPGQHVRNGQALFQEHNCIACHQFYGLGGYMGPDLTNVISNKGSPYARAFLMSGTQRMPNFNLNKTELDEMVSFLEFVDTTGRYPASEYQIRWYGTVVENDE